MGRVGNCPPSFRKLLKPLIQNFRAIRTWQTNARTVITLLLSLCSASSGCSSVIPLLLLCVTIEGRPHSLARELRGDGLKITPLEMGWRKWSFGYFKISWRSAYCNETKVYGYLRPISSLRPYPRNSRAKEWGRPSMVTCKSRRGIP